MVTSISGPKRSVSALTGVCQTPQWASCGYQPSCLPAAALAGNASYDAQSMNDMLMGRMAEGAGVDPSCIDPGSYEGFIHPVVLMPWQNTK